MTTPLEEAVERVKAALAVTSGDTMIAKGSLLRRNDLRTILNALSIDEERLSRIGEAAESAVLSEMSWPEIGEVVVQSIVGEGLSND
jgi:hypothetical protein